MVRDGRTFLAAWIFRVAVAAFVASFATSAHAQGSGIQQTPDSARYLISKDVGSERWAISFNLEDRTVTGNVFATDGSPPSFIFCSIVEEIPAANPADNQYFLDCSGASACASAPCTPSQWTPIASRLPIPGSFLLPDNTLSTLSGNVQPIFTASCATNLSCHVQGGAGPVNLSAGASWINTFRVLATEDTSKFYVNPFDASTSFLFNKVEGTGVPPQMPLNAPPLPADQMEAIRTWILEGGANN